MIQATQTQFAEIKAYSDYISGTNHYHIPEILVINFTALSLHEQGIASIYRCLREKRGHFTLFYFGEDKNF